jgi:hypothetical protein
MAETQKNFLTVRLGRIRSCWLLSGSAEDLLLLPDGDVALCACRRQVRHCLPLPSFYGRTLSRTVPARHAENVQNFGAYQYIGARLKFTVSISAHRRPVKKRKKHKYSLWLSNVSFYTHDLQIEIHRCGLKLLRWGVGDVGGGGGGALLVPPSTCLASRWIGLPQAICAPPLSYKCISLLLNTFLHLAASWTGVDKKIFTLSVQNNPKYIHYKRR